jgi:hypothetical protein
MARPSPAAIGSIVPATNTGKPCGHEYRSEGWRRDLEDAINNPQEWVRDVLIWHKTQARL